MATAGKKKKSRKGKESKGKTSGARGAAQTDGLPGLISKEYWLSFSSPLAALFAGAVLGFSAPGYDQWYLGWFALSPLFLMLYATPSILRQSLIGLFFGLGYNLVYLSWYLNLAPLDWMGFPGIQGIALSVLACFIVSSHQALIIALFSVLIGRLPLCAGYSFKKGKGGEGVGLFGFHIPALSVIPFIWVMVVNKIGNAPDLLGVPWSMLEYSQYKQSIIIQGASVFGGIGLSYVMVAANLAVASLIATFSGKPAFKRLAAENNDYAYYYALGTALLFGAYVGAGLVQDAQVKQKETTTVAVLQGGINIDMQKSTRRITLADIAKQYHQLFNEPDKQKPELAVLPEGAFPTYLSEEPLVQKWLKKEAIEHKCDLIVGSMDRDATRRPFNAAYGITDSGALADQVYYKRYLVPIGEYTPLFVQYMPEWVKRWTNTPAGSAFYPGKEPRNLLLSCGKVAPLICFECISPELTAQSVRNGGQLLVNISDLAWFHHSNCGPQMIAFSVFRAVENRRYFIFAANTGPSAVIDPRGTITSSCGQGKERVMNGKVGFLSQITPFTLWYR